MAENRKENEEAFGEAFAQAAGLPRPTALAAQSAEAAQTVMNGKEAARIGEQGQVGAGEAGQSANAPSRREAHELPQSDGLSEGAHQDIPGSDSVDGTHGEPDYRLLFERERQRLRSLQGRCRKEKQNWLTERRELLEELARVGGDVPSHGPHGPDDPDGPEMLHASHVGTSLPETADSTDSTDSLDLTGSTGSTVSQSSGGPLAAHPELAKTVCALVRATVEEVAGPVLANLELERHVRRIAAAHPDWEELAVGPDLSQWIEGHPAYMAASLRRVAEAGNAEEVIDLLNRFKHETGRLAAARQAEHDQARRQRDAERATAVPSRGAGPVKGRSDKGDFRGAWSEAASTR